MKALILKFDPNRPRATRSQPCPPPKHDVVAKVALVAQICPEHLNLIEILADKFLAAAQ